MMGREVVRRCAFVVATFLAATYFVGLGDRGFEAWAWYPPATSTTWITTSGAYLRALIENSWFQWACVAALFFAFGLSLDGFLERYSNKRQQEIKDIGRSALMLGAAMRQNRFRPQDDEALVQQFAPRIDSAMYARRLEYRCCRYQRKTSELSLWRA